jgi:ferredoxin
MLGAFVNGAIAGSDAAERAGATALPAYDSRDVEIEGARMRRLLKNKDGQPANQVEYKIRRFVNDYLQPPKVARKYQIAQKRFAEIREDLSRLVARDPHELMRALEFHSISRLRRHGCGGLALPNGEPLGPLSLSPRLSSTGRRQLVLSRPTLQGQEGRDRFEETRRRSLCRAAGDRRQRRLPPPAHIRSCLRPLMPFAENPSEFPVKIDHDKCIADKGCTVCVDVCPLDVLRIDPATGKAHTEIPAAFAAHSVLININSLFRLPNFPAG